MRGGVSYNIIDKSKTCMYILNTSFLQYALCKLESFFLLLNVDVEIATFSTFELYDALRKLKCCLIIHTFYLLFMFLLLLCI